MKKADFILLLASVILASCSKNDHQNGQQQDPLKVLPATLYYEWADEGVYALTPGGLSKKILLEDDIKRNYWDVSWDRKFVLESADPPDQDYDASFFRLSNLSDHTVVSQFKYYAAGGETVVGDLSPDGRMIALHPTFEEGIVIIDLQGNVIQHIEKVNNGKIEGIAAWMPDNTLVFPHKKYLLRTNAAFTDASLIKEMSFSDWGRLAVSRDGKKMAFAGDKHIWLMNSDGSDMKQVTTSSAEETAPEFSPDGEYLLIGTDYHTSGPFGKFYYMKVIPADGKQYQVDDGKESEGVIPVQLPGETLSAASGTMRWR